MSTATVRKVFKTPVHFGKLCATEKPRYKDIRRADSLGRLLDVGYGAVSDLGNAWLFTFEHNETQVRAYVQKNGMFETLVLDGVVHSNYSDGANSITDRESWIVDTAILLAVKICKV